MHDRKPQTPAPGRRNDELMPMSGAGLGAPVHAKPGTSMVRMESGPITAIQVAVPRSLKEVQARVIEEVEMMGDSFFYAWTVKDKTSPTGKSLIQGMSVEGAKVLYRNWRNVNYDVMLAEESPTHWTFQGVLVDWETGTTFPRLFRQRKNQSSGDGMNAERQQDMVFQIGQSKLFRNVVAMAMPAWLIDKAMKLAENAEVNRYAENLPKAIFDMLLAARDLGVTKEELWKKAGKEFKVWQDDKTKKWHTDPAAWIPADVARMMAILRAIGDQQTTADVEFRGAKAPGDEPEPTAPTEASTPGMTTGNVEGFDGMPAGESGTQAPAAPASDQTPAHAAPSPSAQSTGTPAPTDRRQRRMREPGED